MKLLKNWFRKRRLNKLKAELRFIEDEMWFLERYGYDGSIHPVLCVLEDKRASVQVQITELEQLMRA